MSLYHDFADHYDAIFPTDPETVGFLAKSFGKGRVLDLGCATGGTVLALRTKGYRADGIDLDEAMIKIARNNAAAIGSPASFGVADIRSLSANALYQGVYCIGNTLPHLTDEQDIQTLVRKMYFALTDGGCAVIQTVNYDRVLDQNVTALPTLRADGRTFTRAYQREGGILRFRTVLTYQDETYRGDVPLYPIRARTVEAMMRFAGFRQVVLFGDFDTSPFDLRTSFALVARGVK